MGKWAWGGLVRAPACGQVEQAAGACAVGVIFRAETRCFIPASSYPEQQASKKGGKEAKAKAI